MCVCVCVCVCVEWVEVFYMYYSLKIVFNLLLVSLYERYMIVLVDCKVSYSQGRGYYHVLFVWDV